MKLSKDKLIKIIIDLYFNKDHYDFETVDDLKVWLEGQLI